MPLDADRDAFGQFRTRLRVFMARSICREEKEAGVRFDACSLVAASFSHCRGRPER